MGAPIENQSALEFPEDLLAGIIDRVAKHVPTSGTDFECSFCDRGRPEVATLISGPRVFICESCVGTAVAAVKHGP